MVPNHRHAPTQLLALACAAALSLLTIAAGPALAGSVANFTVNSIADPGDGTCDVTECTLREAIDAANADVDDSSIAFTGSVTGTIELTGALPTLTTHIDIVGPGARVLAVHRNTGGDYRIFTVAGATVSISGLTITGGGGDVIPGGGGVSGDSTSIVTLTEVTVSDNTAIPSSGGFRDGGGVHSSGNMTIIRSTVTGNTANAHGGGIYSEGTLVVKNSTITDNHAAGSTDTHGGGIDNFGTATLDSDTITGNSADGSSSGQGGGFENDLTATLTNTIVAGNTATSLGPDVRGTFTSGGHNLVGNTADAGGFTDATDQTGVDPALGSLQDNGGPTDTELPTSGSPAVDAGATALTTDQRGASRPHGGQDDTGAVERRVCTNDPLVVTTAADVVIEDDCITSLREALTYANATSGSDTITFDIPGSGVQTIQPDSALPAITDPVTIDGYSQTGASTSPRTIEIVIDGTNAGSTTDGLTITAASSDVKGLAIVNFQNGVVLTTTGAHDNTIEGNFIGLTASGAQAANTNDGVLIHLGAHVNTIGGTTEAARNVISGNDAAGVEVRGQSELTIPGRQTINNVVEGNSIGTDITGTDAIGNTGDGIVVADGAVPTLVTGNLISGNGQAGVGYANNFSAAGTHVTNNLIGTDITGTADLGNTGDGIKVSTTNGILGQSNVISGNGSNGVEFAGTSSGATFVSNYVGTGAGGTGSIGNDGNGFLIGGNNFDTIGAASTGTSSGANVIAHNGLAGVAVTSVMGDLIWSNAIFANGGLGIDLANDGVTANDPPEALDADTGPNGLQNFPVLGSVALTESGATITGTLDSSASDTFEVQFFSSPSQDPSGYGEGQTYLGDETVNTDSAGHATFSADVATPVGSWITATATLDYATDTSEFSAAIEVPAAPPLSADLAIEKTGPTDATVGTPYDYELNITNDGPDAASNVVVLDDLPPGLDYVDSGSSSECDLDTSTADPNDVKCTFPSILALGSRQPIIEVNPNTPGVVTNQVTVSSDTLDPDGTDNTSADVVTTVSNPTVDYAFAWVSPTNAPPNVNNAHAGSIMRIHFTLGGAYGLDVLASGSPWHKRYSACPTGTLVPGSRRHTRPLGQQGLHFNAATNVYTYRWRTRAQWYPALRCQQFQLQLNDGTMHRLNVRLLAPLADRARHG